MKNQLFLVFGMFRANPINGSALNLFRLAHLLPETGISLDSITGKKMLPETLNVSTASRCSKSIGHGT
jgi:hypothetical protein